MYIYVELLNSFPLVLYSRSSLFDLNALLFLLLLAVAAAAARWRFRELHHVVPKAALARKPLPGARRGLVPRPQRLAQHGVALEAAPRLAARAPEPPPRTHARRAKEKGHGVIQARVLLGNRE